jgi:polysaccharide export outer membrane protein
MQATTRTRLGKPMAMSMSVQMATLSLALAMSTASCAHRPPPPSGAREVTDEYRIGREDVVEVAVWRDNDMTRVVPVRPDGKISLPLLGEVNAAGKTGPELAEEIQKRLIPYVENPRVSVIVREINAQRFFVLGEVQKPGSFPLRGDTTVLQALAQAGGLAQFADPDGIVLVRRDADGSEHRYGVKYSQLVDGDRGNPLYLSSGDTLYVP